LPDGLLVYSWSPKMYSLFTPIVDWYSESTVNITNSIQTKDISARLFFIQKERNPNYLFLPCAGGI